MDLYRVLRPLLSALPADMAHDVSQWAMRRDFWRYLPAPRKPRIPLDTTFAGIDMTNPFGLAAGYDKNGDITPAMARLGFSFVVVGSIRAGPHPGNPRPWFSRRLREEGLVNSMGLPSKGATYVRRRLERLSLDVPLIASVTGESADDLVAAYDGMRGVTNTYELNLSCPNTATGRTFEEDLDALDVLLRRLHSDSASLFLKLSPYEAEDERERLLEIGSRAVKRGFRNFTLCNTLPVMEERIGLGRGGLSGRPLFPLALRAVEDFYSEFGEGINIIGVGGILRGKQAYEMLAAGAGVVEILTALILRGPLVVRYLVEELEETLKAKGFRSIDEVTGSGVP